MLSAIGSHQFRADWFGRKTKTPSLNSRLSSARRKSGKPARSYFWFKKVVSLAGRGANVMRHKFSILLLGFFLGTPSLVVAQALAPQSFVAHERVSPNLATLPETPARLLVSSFAISRDARQYVAHLSSSFTEADDRSQRLSSLSSITEVKTLFLTQSRMPLLQLWRGRLQLDGSSSTLHMQNIQLGPSAAGGLQDFRPERRSYPGGPRSIDLCGLSLSFHFGRIVQTGRPVQIWHRLAQIVR